ncbi:MAG: hypothetical protein IKQ56_04745 [Lachnospiraceae bacterium]|nr:hypothetical protein [Lachnospiraceae bacterium]
MSMVKDGGEFYVTCPKCGRVIQRAFTTDSYIKCPKCQYEFYTYISDGVAIVMDAAKLEDNRSRSILLTYAKALSSLKEVPGMDLHN